MEDQEPSWQRQLAVGLAVLVAISALIGSIVAVVALKAVDYAGIGTGSGSSSPAPILPTTGDATATAASTPTTPPPSATSKPRGTPQPITLRASPASVASYQRVNLTGRYPGHDGATLQVQRSVGTAAWSDFPTKAQVSAGSYATYIETGMTGLNRFRMVDTSSGRASNVVTVRIG